MHAGRCQGATNRRNRWLWLRHKQEESVVVVEGGMQAERCRQSLLETAQ
jgi:hypothetical protein